MITRRRLLQLGGLTALGAGWPGGALRALAQSPEQTRRLILDQPLPRLGSRLDRQHRRLLLPRHALHLRLA